MVAGSIRRRRNNDEHLIAMEEELAQRQRVTVSLLLTLFVHGRDLLVVVEKLFPWFQIVYNLVFLRLQSNNMPDFKPLTAFLAFVLCLTTSEQPKLLALQTSRQIDNVATGRTKTLSFTGPETSEQGTPNPFTDYRLMVKFSHPDSGFEIEVPGFYAADNHAGQSSADSGNIWKARFTPFKSGLWNYSATLRTGKDIVIDVRDAAGTSVELQRSQRKFRGVNQRRTRTGFPKQRPHRCQRWFLSISKHWAILAQRRHGQPRESVGVRRLRWHLSNSSKQRRR